MQIYRAIPLIALLLMLAGCATTRDQIDNLPAPLQDQATLQVLVEGVQLNDTLNPKLWQGDRLDPAVRERLLAMADLFIKDVGFDGVEVKEITFAGSNVGYLYHDLSDVDVHISVDGSPITNDLKLLFRLFNSESDDWNSDFDFNMRGYDVELFMLDHRSPEGSAGVYSLGNDRWITKPEKPTNVVDSAVVLADVTRFAAEFEALRGKFTASPDSFDCHEFKAYRRMLKDYRAKQGFQKTGEYSVGNLGFKALRNGGYLDAAKAEQARCLAMKYNLD